MIWSAHLLVCYLLINTACGAGTVAMRALLGGITVAAAALVAFAAYAVHPQLGRDADASAGPAAWDGDGQRSRFMAHLGVLDSAMFFVAILFTAAPIFVLRTCS